MPMQPKKLCRKRLRRQRWRGGNIGNWLSPISNLQLTLEENGIVITGFDTVDRKIDAFIAIFKKTDNIVDALEKR